MIIKEKIQQGIIIALAGLCIFLTILLAFSNSKLKTTQLENARLEALNLAKVGELQAVADQSSVDYEKVEEKHNVTTKNIVQRFEDNAAKNMDTLNSNCIDFDSFGLLQELYVARDAGQLETALLSSATTAGNHREGPK